MKEFKGTKCKDGSLKLVRSNMGFQVLTADSYYSICESVGKRGQEEQVANARLIAASPEMLQALINLAEILGKFDDTNIKKYYGKLAIQYEQILNTIDKALTVKEFNQK